MALSVDDILDAITNMDIYKKDFDVISSLLDYGDDELFTKILEEVLMGNLYWSDFDKNLANTNYPEVLKKQLKSQHELDSELGKLIALRRSVNENYEFRNSDSTLAIVNNYSEDPNEERIQTFYNEEMERIRGNVLYELTRANPDDSVLVMACKTRLFNAIKNGELVLRHQDSNDSFTLPSGVTINETEITYGSVSYTAVTNPVDDSLWKYYEHVSGSSYKITDDIKVDPSKTYYEAFQYKYEYINPNDIFFFINNYIIPLDSKYQVLDEFDNIYMRQNNIGEDTMKQIKMVSMLLKRDARLDPEGGAQ